MSTPKAWTTESELKFLEGLGLRPQLQLSVDGKARPVISRQVLLRRYRAAVKKRKNWGDIDRAKIVQYVENQVIKGDK